MDNSLKVSTKHIVLTCEHGGNKVPVQYRHLFRNKLAVLNTHRAWDKGALILAKSLANKMSVPLIYSEITRLLVDLNRSPHHPHLFSDFSSLCNKQTKEIILDKFYIPYRQQVELLILKTIKKNRPVLHFSIHSFTPELDDRVRNADIGLLYDPARLYERNFCKKLQFQLQQQSPTLNIRRNYPYRGDADGLTTYLRRQYDEKIYTGIEIEMNQKHILSNTARWTWLRRQIFQAIYNVLNNKY